MKWNLLLFSSLLFFSAYGQYPATGNKQRLGYQTTGDGLIYRGNGSPSFTPTGINNAWTYIDTVAGTLYNYFAGSWHELETGGGVTMPLDSVEFNTSYTSQFGTGVMAYDPDNETVSVGIDGGATLQLGQELYYPLVINKSGALIKNGTPVMVDTATLTTGDHVRILPAKNNGIIPSNYIMGVATTDIPNDSTGLVTWFGYVREVKESDIAQSGVTFAQGDILYISATEAGKYTNVAPSTPYHRSTIALVARMPNANNLTLLVRPWLAPRLADLSDVNTSSVTGLSVLRYNSSTSTWDASATAGIVAADTAAMLSNYVTLGTSQTITGTKTVSTLLHRVPGFGQDSFRLDYAAWPVSASQKIPYTISKGSGYYPSTGSMSTFMSRWNWGAVSDYNNASAFVFMGTDASGTGTLSNAAIAEYWNQYSSKSLRIMANGRMAFGNFTPSYSLDLYGKTDAIRLPVGTTAQRPTGAAGVLRYSSTSGALEYHTGTAWQTVATTASTSPWTSTSTTVYLTDKKVGIGTSSPTSYLHVAGSVSFGQITTINTGTYYVNSYENWFICTYAGNTTIYLPDPTTCVGRILHFVNRAAYARNTDALLPEVVPLAGGSGGTSILPATSGKWVTLVSDGTYWQTMEGN